MTPQLTSTKCTCRLGTAMGRPDDQQLGAAITDVPGIAAWQMDYS